MKIGLISSLRGGGVGRFSQHLSRGLAEKQGLFLELFIIDKEIDYDLPQTTQLKVRYLARSNSPVLSKIGAVLNLCTKNPPLDIIHCNYISNAAYLRRFDGNILLTMHGFPRPELEPRIPDKLAYYFEQFSIRFLKPNTKLVTISKFSHDAILRKYGLRTDIVYNGINCEFWSPSENKIDLKQHLGYQGKKLIIYVGRLHPQKDPVTLLKAFLDVTRKIENCILLIVGVGPLKIEMQRIIDRRNDVKLVTSLNELDLLNLYRAADLLVYPSIGEPFGLILVEAMAAGCPCIATNTGASPEILGMQDLLVEPTNPYSLAEKMIHLLENPQYTSYVSDFLTQRANTMFRIERMVDSYHKIYRDFTAS